MALAILTLTAEAPVAKKTTTIRHRRRNRFPPPFPPPWLATGQAGSIQHPDREYQSGQMLGNARQSGKYFSFSADGKARRILLHGQCRVELPTPPPKRSVR